MKCHICNSTRAEMREEINVYLCDRCIDKFNGTIIKQCNTCGYIIANYNKSNKCGYCKKYSCDDDMILLPKPLCKNCIDGICTLCYKCRNDYVKCIRCKGMRCQDCIDDNICVECA